MLDQYSSGQKWETLVRQQLEPSGIVWSFPQHLCGTVRVRVISAYWLDATGQR